MPDPLVVYLAHEYPARSQTFVVSEARALQDAGHDVALFPTHSAWRLADSAASSDAHWVLSWSRALSPSSVRFLGPTMLRLARKIPATARHLALPPWTVRQVLRSAKAVLLAVALATILRARAPGRPIHLHAHFFGLMSLVALICRDLLPGQVTVSITGHAGDVLNPRSAIRLVRESEAADFVACASDRVRAGLLESGSRARSAVVHCGVRPQQPARLPSDSEGTIRLVTVARLVEKKGIDDVLRAVRLLIDRGFDGVSLHVIGDGPCQAALLRLREDLRLTDVVSMSGARGHEDALAVLENQADVFVLPCKVASDGDVDGIPVALMEAMSFGIPVVTTPVSGIPELVIDGETGFLVPPEQPNALADCIGRLISDRDLAVRVGARGRSHVEENFAQSLEAEKLWRLILSCDRDARGRRASGNRTSRGA